MFKLKLAVSTPPVNTPGHYWHHPYKAGRPRPCSQDRETRMHHPFPEGRHVPHPNSRGGREHAMLHFFQPVGKKWLVSSVMYDCSNNGELQLRN